jgi:hypothetical protein
MIFLDGFFQEEEREICHLFTKILPHLVFLRCFCWENHSQMGFVGIRLWIPTRYFLKQFIAIL